nr:MAG TPA: hypothetical protein [Caudoviricetes sp.]
MIKVTQNGREVRIEDIVLPKDILLIIATMFD